MRTRNLESDEVRDLEGDWAGLDRIPSGLNAGLPRVLELVQHLAADVEGWKREALRVWKMPQEPHLVG